MSDLFNCWQCGKALEDVILPLSRREECIACHADQHVCKMCLYFKDAGRGECQEERAEWQSDKERSNFCDYFKPRPAGDSSNAMSIVEQAKKQAMSEFSDWFDEPSEPVGEQSVKDGCEKEDREEKPKSPAEIAEQQLRDLLG